MEKTAKINWHFHFLRNNFRFPIHQREGIFIAPKIYTGNSNITNLNKDIFTISYN